MTLRTLRYFRQALAMTIVLVLTTWASLGGLAAAALLLPLSIGLARTRRMRVAANADGLVSYGFLITQEFAWNDVFDIDAPMSQESARRVRLRIGSKRTRRLPLIQQEATSVSSLGTTTDAVQVLRSHPGFLGRDNSRSTADAQRWTFLDEMLRSPIPGSGAADGDSGSGPMVGL